MKRPTVKTIFHLCEVLEFAKGNRGRKDCNPYGVPEIEAALKHLADLQGIKDWLDAKTVPTNPQREVPQWQRQKRSENSQLPRTSM